MGNPETMVLACPRYKVSKLMNRLPIRFIETLEHNQKIPSCCRHPEEHDIEAFKSRPEEEAPDIYIFHCTCGRKHSRFCVGNDEARPVWTVR